jgi:diaminopimelate epimerase
LMAHRISFTKYHGCGNDFILKDEMTGRMTPDKARSRIAIVLCDRHFSVGADGVIFVEKAKGLDGSMRLFEPAGNEADMCGNGLRCVAAYLMSKLDKTEVKVLTRDGVKSVKRVGSRYRVDMGSVRTECEHLREYVSDAKGAQSDLMNTPISLGERTLMCSIVNTGEPHIVVRSTDLDSEDVRRIGAIINSDRKRFPKGVNINFVETVGPSEVKVRTYERGVYDETLACGTGATASAAVAHKQGWVKNRRVRVDAVGGCLTIELAKDGRAYMTGPAEPVFEGIAWVEA